MNHQDCLENAPQEIKIHLSSACPSRSEICLPVLLVPEAPYRGVILHDGVVQLVAFAGPACQEAGLTDVHVKLFEAPVP